MLWRMSAVPTERSGRCLSLKSTSPTRTPIYANYWREREAAKAAAPPPPPWPAIDPGLLEEGRPKLPAFPLKVFPRQWQEWVSDAAQWAGSSEDYVAQALLASVAGLCGQGVSARITEAWSEPLILWQALVGGPSSGKTPALEWLRRPLGTVERVLAREGGGAGGGLRCRVAGAGEGRGEAAAGRAAVARRADRLAGRAGAQEPARREPARALPRHLGRDRLAVGPRRQDRRQHRGLARSGAAGRGAGGHRRRPGRALPLCLARPRALPLAAHLEADARGRGGERAAAHRPRGRARRRSRWCWPSRIRR